MTFFFLHAHKIHIIFKGNMNFCVAFGGIRLMQIIFIWFIGWIKWIFLRIWLKIPVFRATNKVNRNKFRLKEWKKREHTGWYNRINLNSMTSICLHLTFRSFYNGLQLFGIFPIAMNVFRKQIPFGKITCKYGFLRIN